MKVLRDVVLVKVEKTEEDEIVTESGTKLLVDTSWNPLKHKRQWGIVVSAPVDFSDFANQGIVPEIRDGDKIYFHYNSLSPHSFYKKEGVYAVDYFQVFCAVRDGAIIPIGGWVMTEKIYPPNCVEIDIDGKPAKVIKSGNIVVDYNPKHLPGCGVLAHIGAPKSDGKQLDVTPGETVIYSPDCEFENVIEGKSYFCMAQEDILGAVKLKI